MKRFIPSLNLDKSTVENRDVSKFKNRMTNSVDPDETACYEPSHLDLHCLHRHLCWSAVLKRLILVLGKHIAVSLMRLLAWFCIFILPCMLPITIFSTLTRLCEMYVF